MRFFTKLLVAVMLASFGLTTYAQEGTGQFYIQYPNQRVEYHLGDSLKLRWSAVDFKPSVNAPIDVFLVDLRTKRPVRVGRITAASSNDVYEVNWTIPDDFFSRWYLGERSEAYFWVDLRAFNTTHWVRLKTRQSMMKIFNSHGDSNGGSNSSSDSDSNRESTSENQDTTNNTIDDSEVEDDPNYSETVPTNYLPPNSTVAAQFTIRARLEPWVIDRLSIVSDTENDGFEYDANEGSAAIKRVYLEYIDRFGERNLQPADFINGQARFRDLNIYIDRDANISLKVWVEIAARNELAAQFSGQRFRLGLQTVGNTASTFRAVGQYSGETDSNMNKFTLTDQDPVELITRFSVLDFDLVNEPQRVLTTGDQPIFDLSVASSGNVGLHRLVFDVSQNGVTQLDQVRVLRNGDVLNNVSVYWDAGGSSCDATLTQSGAGTGMNCNGGIQSQSQLIVAFTQEQTITSSPTVYRLDARILGLSNPASVSVRLARGDDNSPLSIGGVSDTTGYLFNNGGGNEIFSTATDFFDEATGYSNRNIIWSDRSADNHRFPSVSSGSPSSLGADGSSDYTNGYLLKVNLLPAVDLLR